LLATGRHVTIIAKILARNKSAHSTGADAMPALRLPRRCDHSTIKKSLKKSVDDKKSTRVKLFHYEAFNT
jgi:hypothetical protein